MNTETTQSLDKDKKWVKNEVIRYVASGYPVIYYDTFEELRILDILKEVAQETEVNAIFTFDQSKGLQCWHCFDEKDKQEYEKHLSMKPTGRKTLGEISEYILKQVKKKAFIVFRDAHQIFGGPNFGAGEARNNIRTFKNMLQENEGRHISFHWISQDIHVPIEIARDVIIVDVPLPSRDEIKKVFENTILPWGIEVNENLRDKFVEAMAGLGEEESENLINFCLQKDGIIDEDDLVAVTKYKQQMIRKTKVLELVDPKENLEDIGGLESLKGWLEKKKHIFNHMEEARQCGIGAPKGILIAGMPGCGKSMTAKAASILFEVPLLHMDMGMILGPYVGNSEQNIRQATKLAESIAPCVLWIDELEKAFRGTGKKASGGGSETITRVFGTILTWMQEKTKPVFVIAVANTISEIPPEFFRKGRFDELFFVDFPVEDERVGILRSHLKKRLGHLNNIDSLFENLNLNDIVKHMENFSGAEIEAVVKEIIEDKFINNLNENIETGDFLDIDTRDFLDKLKTFSPLANIMKADIDEMRKKQKEYCFKNATKRRENNG